MAIIDTTRTSFADAVSQGAVVVDYSAEWCSPCKQLEPILNELSEYYDGRVRFLKVDTVSEPDLTAEQGILSLPTVQFWKDGQMVNRMTGAKPKDSLTAAIEGLL